MGAQDGPSAIVSAEFEVFGKVQGQYRTSGSSGNVTQLRKKTFHLLL
jgi:hypothetical protein